MKNGGGTHNLFSFCHERNRPPTSFFIGEFSRLRPVSYIKDKRVRLEESEGGPLTHWGSPLFFFCTIIFASSRGGPSSCKVLKRLTPVARSEGHYGKHNS